MTSLVGESVRSKALAVLSTARPPSPDAGDDGLVRDDGARSGCDPCAPSIPRSDRSDQRHAPTPRRIRLGAAAWLLGPAVLGAAAVVSRPARLGVLAGAVASACWAMLVAGRGSRDEPVAAPAEHPARAITRPSVSVVVAARDEADVLPGLLADLAAQDLRDADGTPLFDVTLIDDHSGDATLHLMESARDGGSVPVTRVVHLVEGAADGKGSALRAVPPDELRGDVVCILDADARIWPSFLRVASSEALAHRAVTARRRVLGREASAWAALQDDEQTVDAFIQRGRWSLGGCPEFRGDGIVVERRLLVELGGWAARSLTEDLDLSTRLAAAGIVVAVPPHLVVRESPLLDIRSFRAQRLRWAEGSVRRYLAHGPAVLRSRHLTIRARLEFTAYAAQLAAPSLLLGAVVAGALRRRPALPIALAGAYVAGGAAVAYRALSSAAEPSTGELSAAEAPAAEPPAAELPSPESAHARHVEESPLRLARRAAAVALFGSAWAVVVPVALVSLIARRGPPVHSPTPHRHVEPA